MWYDPRPPVMEVRSASKDNISAMGTSALMSCMEPEGSMPWGRPRRDERSPITEPAYSSGTAISTDMIGSSKVGRHLGTASLKASEPAILKDISDESTSWYWPSYSSTAKSTMG